MALKSLWSILNGGIIFFVFLAGVCDAGACEHVRAMLA